MLHHLKIAPAAERHEEVFLARYTRLRGWALQLTERDRERAEDLVHDAYIQFTFTRPDLNTISHLDAYLYTMLRNLHLSQVRRTLRLQHRSLVILDYDSAEIGLRGADPREQMRLQDELRQVCQYACLRKETSKAGSVLILRFMHGYYPREIAQIMQSTRQAVEERLRMARSEARQYLLDPTSLRFIRETPAETAGIARAGFARTSDELLQELRDKIFDSCRGSCFASEHLEQIYREAGVPGMDHQTLGHIVSCPKCLDCVNRLLDLPMLCERFPTDTLGTDNRSDGGEGGGGGAGSGSTGGPSEGELRRCRRRASDVFEHRPVELCISVNGYLMATQRVGSELSEQTLSINSTEKIDFIEVFSEQEVRLLYVSIEELPPEGDYKRSISIRLSDDRMLEASLSFSNPWPTLQVIYRDPLLQNERASHSLTAEETCAPHQSAPMVDSSIEVRAAGRRTYVVNLLERLARLCRWFFNPSFWLRPGTVTAVVSLILIAVLLLTRMHVPVVSAAELLRRSTVAEQTIAGDPAIVLHRTINMEERRAKGGALISRRRIEIWQSAARGIRLRRIYDEQQGLVAGEWTRDDGTSTLYRREAAPQARTAPDVAARAILETGELWRLEVSARSFAALVGRAEGLTVEERSNTYVLDYAGEAAGGSTSRLRRATLTLGRADLHPVEETLNVERDGEEREYRFIEAGLERSPASAIAPSLFEPEPELLGTTRRAGESSLERQTREAEPLLSASPVAVHPPEAVASPELEIEVTYLLNQIRADLGEQVSMTRTAGGTLRVEALVETERRKEEILRALGSIINNPAVRVEVSTVGEAFKRQQEERSQPRDTPTREVEVTNNRIPADAELRSYFSARLVGNQAIDKEIDRYTQRVMNRSRQALLRASALKRLVGRFSPDELRALDPQAQTRWRLMIREHAEAYQREAAALRQELRPVFKGSGETAGEGTAAENLAQTSERLLKLSYANDEAVRSAFTISTDGRSANSINTQQFWRSLDTAKRLAATIQSAYQ